jgi:hypothetical protein
MANTRPDFVGINVHARAGDHHLPNMPNEKNISPFLYPGMPYMMDRAGLDIAQGKKL